MRIFLLLLITLALASPLLSEENPSRRPIPDPTWLAPSNSLSLFVVSARPEKSGLRQLFKTALSGTSLMSAVISRQNQQNLIMASLPLQWVRIDQPDAQGRLRTLTVLSVSGWQGMQAQGSFINCATPDLARQTIDRLLDRPSPSGKPTPVSCQPVHHGLPRRRRPLPKHPLALAG